MRLQTTFFGAATYTLITFALSGAWHEVVVGERYLSFAFLGAEPDLLTGVAIIFMQGLVLSSLYPYVKFRGRYIKRGIKFSLAVGLLYWLSHIPWMITSQPDMPTKEIALLATAFLIVQFGTYGALIGALYNQFSRK